MKYSVYQHWDPLKVCIVGRSYSPEFYSFIKNPRVRNVMERIASETEEDYQKLITLLESFGVEVLRPDLTNNYEDYYGGGLIPSPPMTPRDYSIMLGNDFYFQTRPIDQQEWNALKSAGRWPLGAPRPPETYKEFLNMPQWVIDKLSNRPFGYPFWSNVLDRIKNHVNLTTPARITENSFLAPLCFNSAQSTRVGKDVYLGTQQNGQDLSYQLDNLRKLYPNYRWHSVNTAGHSDGTFCPVVPGLIVSLRDIPTYRDTFPGWEVIYLPGQSWNKVKPFLKLKEKNQGKWWVPGEELNDDFTYFVESWLKYWVGYVEETVFDVNMLVIDEKNVVCNNYNAKVFKAFDRYGITPHVINFRHRYFWDGGLHCITSDIHREGVIKDYFPDRDLPSV